MPRGTSGGVRVELIDVGGRRWDGAAAGPQIVGAHIGGPAEEFHVAPLPPVAFVAPIGLLVRQSLTEAFETVSQSRRVDPNRRAPRALHGGPQFRGRLDPTMSMTQLVYGFAN